MKWFIPRAFHRPDKTLPRTHLHLFSDSTGETLQMVANAVLAQFENVDVVRHFWPMVRSRQHLERITPELEKAPGLILYTLVDEQMRKVLEEKCHQLGLPAVDALGEVTGVLETVFGQEAHGRPGRQHRMDDAYFRRVDAIHFTIAHDDGVGSEDWHKADILLTGVSRTSKTPTCIYLANRGLKAANVPIVPGIQLPEIFEILDRQTDPLIVGLTTDPKRLVQIRRNRIRLLDHQDDTDYVDPEFVRNEVATARRLFSEREWPVIDVTRRSIEETAATILQILERQRQSYG